jgi:hypothetical protein
VFFHQGELAIDIRGKRFAGVEGIAGDIERWRSAAGGANTLTVRS